VLYRDARDDYRWSLRDWFNKVSPLKFEFEIDAVSSIDAVKRETTRMLDQISVPGAAPEFDHTFLVPGKVYGLKHTFKLGFTPVTVWSIGAKVVTIETTDEYGDSSYRDVDRKMLVELP
jgi:hypothetical protein